MKNLSVFLKKNSGRNNQGRITVRHRGGGHKRRYRLIDFVRVLNRCKGVVYKVEYDPNRNCFIGLILYENGLLSYVLGYNGIKVGDILNFIDNSFVLGSVFYLKEVSIGSLIYNVEFKPGMGGCIARSAGSYCQVINKYVYGNNLILVRLKSGEEYLLNKDCKVNLGSVSIINSKFKTFYKAGQRRWLGWRPTVRGVAMNPVDHPHGGGEGKTSGGRPSVSPKGFITKGKPTRSVQKFKNRFIVKRRSK